MEQTVSEILMFCRKDSWRHKGWKQVQRGAGRPRGLSARTNCDPVGDNPAHWNTEKTPADKLSFSPRGVFTCTDISVNQLSVTFIQLSFCKKTLIQQCSLTWTWWKAGVSQTMSFCFSPKQSELFTAKRRAATYHWAEINPYLLWSSVNCFSQTNMNLRECCFSEAEATRWYMEHLRVSDCWNERKKTVDESTVCRTHLNNMNTWRKKILKLWRDYHLTDRPLFKYFSPLLPLETLHSFNIFKYFSKIGSHLLREGAQL